MRRSIQDCRITVAGNEELRHICRQQRYKIKERLYIAVLTDHIAGKNDG